MFSLHWLVPRFQCSWIGSAIGAVAGIAGGLIGADSQSDTNRANSAMSVQQMDFQKEQNQKAMDFSREMSDTQWRRGVADMRGAGLNPMLAYSQGPASSPTGVTSAGSMAKHEAPFTPQSFGTAAQMASFGQQIEQGIAQTGNIKADTQTKGASEDLMRAQAIKTLLEAGTEEERPQLVREQTRAARERSNVDSITHRFKQESFWPTIDKLMSDIRLTNASAEEVSQRNVLMKKLLSDPSTKDGIMPYIWDYFRSK